MEEGNVLVLKQGCFASSQIIINLGAKPRLLWSVKNKHIGIKFSLSSSKKYSKMGQCDSTQLYFAAHEIKGLQNNAIKLN